MKSISNAVSVLAMALALNACGAGGSHVGDDDDSAGGADSGAGEFADGGVAGSCRQVDVVIAVDGSSSMTEELVAMRNDVFPSFAERLSSIGQGLDDFRVATIDACPAPANYHTRGAGGECNFAGGNVWIESSSPDMNSEFACVGDLFTGDVDCSGKNDDEQPASAAATSLEAPYLDTMNAGFSRPEALLVVVAITDEDEQPTGASKSPQQVYDRLVATKGGDVRRMVFLGIGGGSNCEGVYGSADHSVDLAAITNLFIAQGRGVWWDLCDGRLEDGLEQAFDVIEQACDELPPVL